MHERKESKISETTCLVSARDGSSDGIFYLVSGKIKNPESDDILVFKPGIKQHPVVSKEWIGYKSMRLIEYNRLIVPDFDVFEGRAEIARYRVSDG